MSESNYAHSTAIRNDPRFLAFFGCDSEDVSKWSFGFQWFETYEEALAFLRENQSPKNDWYQVEDIKEKCMLWIEPESGQVTRRVTKHERDLVLMRYGGAMMADNTWG